MFSIPEVREIIKLPKFLNKNNVRQQSYFLNYKIPFRNKFFLINDGEPELNFIYDINQSAKNLLKLTLFLLEEGSKTGLIRIDYSGIHTNPETAPDIVPSELKKYAGKIFGYNEPHIHIYVPEGYKSNLSWAMPLSDFDFETKLIGSDEDIINAFHNFNNLINLQTKFQIDLSFL